MHQQQQKRSEDCRDLAEEVRLLRGRLLESETKVTLLEARLFTSDAIIKWQQTLVNNINSNLFFLFSDEMPFERWITLAGLDAIPTVFCEFIRDYLQKQITRLGVSYKNFFANRESADQDAEFSEANFKAKAEADLARLFSSCFEAPPVKQINTGSGEPPRKRPRRHDYDDDHDDDDDAADTPNRARNGHKHYEHYGDASASAESGASSSVKGTAPAAETYSWSCFPSSWLSAVKRLEMCLQKMSRDDEATINGVLKKYLVGIATLDEPQTLFNTRYIIRLSILATFYANTLKHLFSKIPLPSHLLGGLVDIKSRNKTSPTLDTVDRRRRRVGGEDDAAAAATQDVQIVERAALPDSLLSEQFFHELDKMLCFFKNSTDSASTIIKSGTTYFVSRDFVESAKLSRMANQAKLLANCKSLSKLDLKTREHLALEQAHEMRFNPTFFKQKQALDAMVFEAVSQMMDNMSMPREIFQLEKFASRLVPTSTSSNKNNNNNNNNTIIDSQNSWSQQNKSEETNKNQKTAAAKKLHNLMMNGALLLSETKYAKDVVFLTSEENLILKTMLKLLIVYSTGHGRNTPPRSTNGAAPGMRIPHEMERLFVDHLKILD
jgi:hypothetical protein